MTAPALFWAGRPLSALGLARQNAARAYSMWPTSFLDPVNYRELPAFQNEQQIDLLAKHQYKAAHNRENASVFYKPIIIQFQKAFMRKGQEELSNQLLIQICKLIKEKQMSLLLDAKSDKEKAAIVVDPFEIIEIAVKNATPLMRLHTVKVGSVVYQIPSPINDRRATFEAMRWIINIANDRKKSEVTFTRKIAEVLLDTAANQGSVIKAKEEHHKLCEQNRAYTHFRHTA